MTKLKSSYRKLIYIIGAFVLMAAFAFTGFACFTAPNSSLAVEDALDRTVSDSISVTAMTRPTATAGSSVYEKEDGFNLTTFDGINTEGYYWSKLGTFKIGYKVGQETIEANPSNKYDYSVEFQFVQKRATEAGSFTDSAASFGPQKIFEGSVDNLADIDNLFYSIDTVTEDGSTAVSKNYGWGIYRFILTINGVECNSMLYYVAPSEIREAPHVTKTEVQATTSIQSAYLFTIDNASYKYVDQNLIRWYVEGSSNSGTKYCLLDSDIGTRDFPSSEYKVALFDALDRDGTSFRFETDVAGTWNVYCVVYDKAPTPENINTITESFSTKDAKIQVETGKKVQPSTIIWIIVACSVVLLGVIIFIIVKSVKKEKVW